MDVPREELLPGLVLLSALFVAGAIFGRLAASYASGGMDEALRGYISGYLTLSEQGAVSSPDAGAVFLTYYRYPLIAFLLGFTSLGVAVIPALAAVRGFFLSFAISSFTRLYGSQGVILSAAAFGVQCAVTLPCFLMIGAQAFAVSCRLASVSFKHGKRGRPAMYREGYFLRCGICALLLLPGVAAELLIVPKLVALAAGGL